MMDTRLSTPRHAAPKGWWRWLMLASLVGNLAVAGLFVGASLSDHGPRPPAGPAAIGPIARALDPADRRALAEAMRESGPPHATSPAERRARYEALVTAIAAVPFEPDVLAGLLAAMQAEGAAMQDRSEALLLAHITAMDDAGRAALAARLTGEFRDGPRDGSRDGPRDGQGPASR